MGDLRSDKHLHAVPDATGKPNELLLCQKGTLPLLFSLIIHDFLSSVKCIFVKPIAFAMFSPLQYTRFQNTNSCKSMGPCTAGKIAVTMPLKNCLRKLQHLRQFSFPGIHVLRRQCPFSAQKVRDCHRRTVPYQCFPAFQFLDSSFPVSPFRNFTARSTAVLEFPHGSASYR